MPLGQLTCLPPSLATNPFHRLIVKFSRYKTGSFEILFTIESYLLRFSWLGLLLLFALVLPPLEEVDYVSTLVRLSTLIYPCFFIWSLTRISGVELMQLVLEGHWTGELMASTLTNRDLTNGFITPPLVVVRQYVLISIFSLILYGLETHVIVIDEGHWYVEDFVRTTLFNFDLFFSAIAWTLFVYLGRLYTEVRLRNGLIKGLATLALLLSGLTLIVGYNLLFWRYPERITHTSVLGLLALLTLALIGASAWLYGRLSRHFRPYLFGQLDLDPLIFDESDPHATAWCCLVETGRAT